VDSRFKLNHSACLAWCPLLAPGKLSVYPNDADVEREKGRVNEAMVLIEETGVDLTD
jgi:hypothetical protein